MWPNPQETSDLVTFTEEILNWKLHFLCSVVEDQISLTVAINIGPLLNTTLREKCSVYGVFLVRIFPNSDWIRRDTLYTGKYGPEKLWIRTRFTQCCFSKLLKTKLEDQQSENWFIFNVFNNFDLIDFGLALLRLLWFWTYFSRKKFITKQFNYSFSRKYLL